VITNRILQRRSAVASHQRGFTLIELMAVLVIIGIMTALIIPEMRGSYGDALLKSSARELMSVCNLASSQAIAANQSHRVRLDTVTGRYFLEKRVRGGSRDDNFVALRDLPGGEGTIDKRISIEVRAPDQETAGESTVQSSPASRDSAQSEQSFKAIGFYSDGTADATQIILSDRDGFRMALRINAITARVSALEMERK
jgi:type II secretion system protein H